MNKKYVSVFLFSALLMGTAGTFTSCKDYDDDITNLQGQIDTQASDLESKLSAVNSSISSLQSAQSSLQSAIAAAETAAEQAALEAQTTAIETAAAQLESVKADLQAAIESNAAASNEALNAAVAAAETAMQEVVGRIAALEAFSTTTTEALTNLQNASDALQTQIKTLSEKTQATLTEHGQRLAALETQIETLNNYKESNDAAVAGVNAQIDEILKELEGMAALETSIADVNKLLEEYKAANDAAVGGVATDVTELNSQVEALKAQLAEAEAALTAAGTDIDGLDTQVASLQQQLDALAAGQLGQADLDAITKQITENVKEQLETMSETITKQFGEKLDKLAEALGQKVTHVEIVNFNLDGADNSYVQGKAWVMNLCTTKSRVDYTFGKDESEAKLYTVANQREFKKDEYTFLTDSIVIRVSPSNATLTADQITFVNSELGSLDELVTIESIEPVKGMVTTRGISANGLWKVKFKMDETKYTADAYNAASLYAYEAGMSDEEVKKLKSIYYAVGVKDTPEETDRYVTSDYKLTLSRDYSPVYGLEFKVNDEDYTNFRNRFYQAEDYTYVFAEDGNLRYDYKWETEWNSELGYNDLVVEDGKFVSVVDGTKSGTINIDGKEYDRYYGGDVRNDQSWKFLNVNVNEKFTVSLDYTAEELAGIYGFYVTLDANRAVESAPSEINAWNSYVEDIAGLNQITTGSELTLSINDASAYGDILGFRVYAINQDGTLVDPDGKAFYVVVGEIEEVELGKLTFAPTQENNGTTNTINLPEEIAELINTGNPQVRFTVDKENNPTPNSFKLQFRSDNGYLMDIYDGGFTYFYRDEITKLQIAMYDAAWTYKDNSTYTGTFEIMNDKGAIAKRVKVSFTKTMPEFPGAFSAKANQLDKEGAMVVEIDRNNWNNDVVRNLGTAFNDISTADNAIVNWNYTFECTNEQIKFHSDWGHVDARYGFDLVPTSLNETAKLFADKDAGKVYDIAVSYVYEGISSESEDHNYEVNAPAEKNFKLRLVCGEGLTSEWVNVDKDKKPVKAVIKYNTAATSTYTETIAASNMAFKLDGTAVTDLRTLNIKDCHLVTNGVNDEYFKVRFDGTNFVCESILSENPPLSDVNATLTFKMVDFFGHETTVSYPYITIKVAE